MENKAKVAISEDHFIMFCIANKKNRIITAMPMFSTGKFPEKNRAMCEIYMLSFHKTL